MARGPAPRAGSCDLQVGDGQRPQARSNSCTRSPRARGGRRRAARSAAPGVGRAPGSGVAIARSRRVDPKRQSVQGSSASAASRSGRHAGDGRDRAQPRADARRREAAASHARSPAPPISQLTSQTAARGARHDEYVRPAQVPVDEGIARRRRQVPEVRLQSARSACSCFSSSIPPVLIRRSPSGVGRHHVHPVPGQSERGPSGEDRRPRRGARRPPSPARPRRGRGHPSRRDVVRESHGRHRSISSSSAPPVPAHAARDPRGGRGTPIREHVVDGRLAQQVLRWAGLRGASRRRAGRGPLRCDGEVPAERCRGDGHDGSVSRCIRGGVPGLLTRLAWSAPCPVLRSRLVRR